jgi:hypothetical protein
MLNGLLVDLNGDGITEILMSRVFSMLIMNYCFVQFFLNFNYLFLS